jgi:SAM-dependent methyltransferase
MHLNSKLIFTKYAKEFFCSHHRVLEIGPDSFPSSFQIIINDASIIWDTLDLTEDSNLTYSNSEEFSFPIQDERYDIVLSANVIEHVHKPWIWIKEVSRVCKIGGTIITVTPVSWPYHEAPVDCWRIYPKGMKALYDEASIELILNKLESLEIPHFRHYIPGRSPEWQSYKETSIADYAKKESVVEKLLVRLGYGWKRRKLVRWQMMASLSKLLGLPVERAYDTITIGMKKSNQFK